MPGLFDNVGNNGGILGLLMGRPAGVGGIAGNMNPAYRESDFRQGAYDALAQQNGPNDAAILMGAPGAYGLGFQRQLFMDQLRSLMGPDLNHPQMSLNEALYRLSPEGQKQQYGVNFGPPVEAGSAKAPIVYGQGQPPHLFNVGSPTGQQPQPTQQPAALSPQPQGPQPSSAMDALAALGAKYKGQEKAAETAAQMQPGFPQALVKAHQTISALEAIRDDGRLESITGRVAGGLPARYSSAPDLVNAIDSANNLLLNDTLTSARNISGRAINAGTLKEIRPYDLNADRLGGADSLRADINRAIKTIQDETDAAWVGSNSPAEYKPVWGKTQPQQAPTTPQVGEIRKGHKFLGGNPADPKSWQIIQQTM